VAQGYFLIRRGSALEKLNELAGLRSTESEKLHKKQISPVKSDSPGKRLWPRLRLWERRKPKKSQTCLSDSFGNPANIARFPLSHSFGGLPAVNLNRTSICYKKPTFNFLPTLRLRLRLTLGSLNTRDTRDV
jgi:hypothetical protein